MVSQGAGEQRWGNPHKGGGFPVWILWEKRAVWEGRGVSGLFLWPESWEEEKTGIHLQKNGKKRRGLQGLWAAAVFQLSDGKRVILQYVYACTGGWKYGKSPYADGETGRACQSLWYGRVLWDLRKTGAGISRKRCRYSNWYDGENAVIGREYMRLQ